MTLQDIANLIAPVASFAIGGGIFMIVVLVRSFRQSVDADKRHQEWLAQFPPMTGPPGPCPYVDDGQDRPEVSPGCLGMLGVLLLVMPFLFIGWGIFMLWMISA